MKTDTVSLHDMQSQLSEILSLVSEGNTVIISDNEKPFAKIIPIVKQKRKRIAGLNKGKIRVREDFDAPLPDEFWEGLL